MEKITINVEDVLESFQFSNNQINIYDMIETLINIITEINEQLVYPLNENIKMIEERLKILEDKR